MKARVQKTIRNDFHNVEYNIRPMADFSNGYTYIPARTMKRLDKKICPDGCTCGGSYRNLPKDVQFDESGGVIFNHLAYQE